jgi:hypothetical protein
MESSGNSGNSFVIKWQQLNGLTMRVCGACCHCCHCCHCKTACLSKKVLLEGSVKGNSHPAKSLVKTHNLGGLYDTYI